MVQRGTPTKFFRSLNREFHVMGVDRQLFFLFVGLTLPIAFSARLTFTMDLVAMTIFIIFHAIGILITRVDRQMLAIYRAHIYYKKYYAAHPGIHAKIPFVRSSVPVYIGQKGWV